MHVPTSKNVVLYGLHVFLIEIKYLFPLCQCEVCFYQITVFIQNFCGGPLKLASHAANDEACHNVCIMSDAADEKQKKYILHFHSLVFLGPL